MIINVNNLEQTNQLALRLAEKITPPFLIQLEGDLGAGKTTFTKMLGKALGITETINSPTFTILKQYPGLNHIDAYRLEGINQSLGFEELFESDDAITVIEWGQFIESMLPQEKLVIYIHYISDEQRGFEFIANGERYLKIVEAL